MKITSPEFKNEEMIPKQFTCDGEGITPSLSFEDVPENCQSLALVMEDPDAPNGTYIHWLIWNITPDTSEISNELPRGAVAGVNSSGDKDYVPPCPPSGIHHYIFRLFALDKMLVLDPTSSKDNLVQEMEGHIVDRAELTGLYGS